MKTNQFMLYGAEEAICSEENTKQIHCGQNVISKVLNLLVQATSRL